jgi:hypothetical protein
MRRIKLRLRLVFRPFWVVIAGLLLTAPAFAQGRNSSLGECSQRRPTGMHEPRSHAGWSLVAIVVAGLTFAFGEGGSKRILAGVLFGVEMAMPQ